ncbi:MAG: hypothetical protein ACXWLH_04895 [Candidatus Saccharimonadales bacterium]
MAFEVYPKEWSVHEGYEEFVDRATEELDRLKDGIRDLLSPLMIRICKRHPNGFLVCRLARSSEGQIRLHIWPTGIETDVTPHSHPWHMVSIVLAGVYREYIPEVKLDDTSSNGLTVSTFDKDGKQIDSTPSGRNVSFDLGEITEYPADNMHKLPAGAFHATPLPQEQPIVTLVRTSPQLYPNPNFVESDLNRELKMPTEADRHPPTEQQVQAIWSELKPLL